MSTRAELLGTYAFDNDNQARNSIDEEISASGNPKSKHKLNQTNIFSRTNVDRLTSSNSIEINPDLLQSSKNSNHMIRINVTQVIFECEFWDKYLQPL